MAQRLESMVALTESVECRTAALLACFGETLGGHCGHCDNCARPGRAADFTVEAQKLISAVVRTGQRFGAQHVISVLLGETTETVRKYRHDALPTFGVGRDRSRMFWRGAVRNLVARGVLSVEPGQYSTLSVVVEQARAVLRGEQKVMLRAEEKAMPAPAGSVRGAGARSGRASGESVDSPAFRSLRSWRAEEARTQRVPPYLIFHDSVLREIASAMPSNLAELNQVRGVGANKLLRYGPAVLSALRARSEAGGESERANEHEVQQ